MRSKEKQKEWYQDHRQTEVAKAVIRRREFKKTQYVWIHKYFEEHPCVDCGETDPPTLDFDHVTGIKIKAVTQLIGGSWEKLFAEIDKCVVRCRNCHARKTAREQNWYGMYNPFSID